MEIIPPDIVHNHSSLGHPNSTQSTPPSSPTITSNQPSPTSFTQSQTGTNSASATPSPSPSSSASDPFPTSSATSAPTPTATSSTPSATTSTSPAGSSQTNSQPSPTSTSSNVQPTSTSSSRPDGQTSSSASSPAPTSTPVQTSTENPPPQSSSSPSPVINTSSESVAPSSSNASLPPVSSQAPPQIVTSNVFRTSTDFNGAVHTITSYVEVTVDRPAATVSAPGETSIAQLHNGDGHSAGFFDNRGAVIGTFLTVGLIVLGGSAAIIWRLARLRRARMRAREDEDAEINFNKFVANDEDGRVAMLPVAAEQDDFHTIPLSHEPQHPHSHEAQFQPQFSNQQPRDPMLAYVDDPSHSNMQEVSPVRFSHRTHRTGRSSDLDTMNTEEWGRYISTHFSTGGGRAFSDGNKPELVRVDEEGAITAGPPIIIYSPGDGPEAADPSSFHLPPVPQPEIETVEEENFTMVSPPRFHLQDQIPAADQRLEPTVLPGYNLQRPESDQQDELVSLRDEEDYSRRILRVSNPDGEAKEDQPSTTKP
ncbi:hypothetical protein MJO28_014134 [Puccinia striiformis f. sp. tritici]|uniref:REJ domain-containing protein n=2 Tax=Puccinia striiformis f. sp. tritici TaxID=168172 RepID=A0A0L0W171_9BASI|nr:hypothetical protein MJO28_014134 [Puccinia striiformis f. sp. tritici]KAI7941886.1 hypothetical protein MJO29_013960 [Puccinia striiformis f. sp. tritici]KAI7946202.1 hypothetical protein MJO29_010729 [Puccinia striiformis f. sp. tritici]KNF05222.1 hypothetical protein PSTG_01845 [Puccinia striiformis f. sp. tritici PST-78]